MSVFNESQDICRICLENRELFGQLIDINIPESDGLLLIDFLMQLTNIKFSENDGFPLKICVACFDLSFNTYHFIKMVNKSHKTLLSWKITESKLDTINYKGDLVENRKDEEIDILGSRNEENVQSVRENTFESSREEENVVRTIEENNLESKRNGAKISIYEDNVESEKCDAEIISYEDNIHDRNEYDLIESRKEEVIYIEIPNEDDNIKLNNNSAIDLDSGDLTCHKQNNVESGNDLSLHEKNHNKNVINHKSLKNLRRHKKETKMIYSCDICSKQCVTKNSFQRHLTVHDNQREKKVYKCKICEKEFLYRSFLIQHMPVHSDERHFLCNHCGNSYRSKSSLNCHKKLHTGEAPYQCEFCDRKFRVPGHLREHNKSHNDVRPFICEICGSTFKRKFDLKVHQRTHSGEKPALCNLCGKGFISTGQLTIHIRTHTGEKPYKCKPCSKEFVSKTALVKHKRIHTGERPYACNICDKSFNQSSTLKTHKLIHGWKGKVKRKVADYL